MNLQISVMHGYVANTLAKVDAIVIPISLTVNAHGRENRALINKAEGYFHNSLEEERGRNGLVDGKVYPVFGNKLIPPWNFQDVLFLIDDLKVPLKEMVYTVLTTAKALGYKDIAIPAAHRMGLKVDKRVVVAELVANEFRLGIGKFAKHNYFMKIYIHIPDNHPYLFSRFKLFYS